jgi:hypothetical protein
MSTKPQPKAVGTYTIERELWHYDEKIDPETARRTYTRASDGTERITVELSIDLAALAHDMGLRAAHGRKGVSKAKDGIIVGRVIARARKAEEAAQ